MNASIAATAMHSSTVQTRSALPAPCCQRDTVTASCAAKPNAAMERSSSSGMRGGGGGGASAASAAGWGGVLAAAAAADVDASSKCTVMWRMRCRGVGV